LGDECEIDLEHRLDVDSEATTGSRVSPEAGALLCVLENLGYGALVLDRSGLVLLTNQKAKRYLGAELEVCCRVAVGKQAFGIAHTGLRDALRTAGLQDYVITVPRTTKRPLVLWTVCLSGSRPADPDVPVTALVVLDLHDCPRPAERLLEQVFGLTPAECKVACLLAAGDSLTEISKALNIGIGTVRTQLKSIFMKTATRRQGQLIALLSHLAHVQRPSVGSSIIRLEESRRSERGRLK
jgi:DNA-binding CsgD family transcriptional regulator